MKKEQKTEISRKRILEAAIKEFGEYGYQGASINHVCDEGIPKGLIYHIFKNRDELYIACVDECYKELLHFLSNADLKFNLKKYLSVRMIFFTEQTAKGSIIIETMMNCPQDLYHSIETIRGEFDQYNYNFFQTVLSDMKLRKNISVEDAMKYFSLVQLLFNSYIEKPGAAKDKSSTDVVKHEEVLSKIIDLLLYGIAEGESNYETDMDN